MKKERFQRKKEHKNSFLKHLKYNASNPAKATKRCSDLAESSMPWRETNPLAMPPYYSGSRIFSKKKW